MARTDTMRDILMLSSFACTAFSLSILFTLLYRFPQLTDSRLMNSVPSDWKHLLKAFRSAEIACAGLVLLLSGIAFAGLFFRSKRLLKIGLRLLFIVILAEIAFVVYVYFQDPAGARIWSRVWLNMSDRQKYAFKTEMNCYDEDSCRQAVNHVIGSPNSRWLVMMLGIGLGAFQILTLLLGVVMLQRLGKVQPPPQTPLPYSYPPGPAPPYPWATYK